MSSAIHWKRAAWLALSFSVLVACGAKNSDSGSGNDDTSTSGKDGGKGSTKDGGSKDGGTRVVLTDGGCASGCNIGEKCTTSDECASGDCSGGVCTMPSCTNGVMDGTETALDCGGGDCPGCADNLACAANTDCISQHCDVGASNVCLAPTATDGILNGTETDVDCGSSGGGEMDSAPPCQDGQMCKAGTDCLDDVCGTMNTCLPAACMDGFKNGSETDVDCGGMCSPCADTKGCAAAADCTSLHCDDTTKTCDAPTSGDGIKNGNETDVDCGSSAMGEATNAFVCSDGQGCGKGTDCVDKVCGTNGKCSAPSCSDGVQNGTETDVDCGNVSVTKCLGCADHLKCTTGTDCSSLVCSGTASTCTPPTSSDGVANGTESDVDCGSSGSGENTNASPCKDILPTTTTPVVYLPSKCNANVDCKSGFCNVTEHQCVDGQSCSLPAVNSAVGMQDIKTHATTTADAVGQANANGGTEYAGIDSCGKGESTDAVHTHDSCCRSLDVAVAGEGKTIRIDKYEVTTGRMRQFAEAIKALEGGDYNVKKWVTDQIAGNTTAGQTMKAQFPIGQTVGGTVTTDTRTLFPTTLGGALGLAFQLGGTTMDNGYPSGEQGCFMGPGEYAASTYWFDAADSMDVGSPPRAFTQDYYDIKPQNCLPYWMAAAFCAWDGGSLPTTAEYHAIWGTASYPWGSASRTYENIGNPPAGTAITDWTIDNLNDDGNSGFFYFYPSANGDTVANPSNPGTGPLSYDSIIDTTSNGYDNSPFIAAPGRFTRDATSLGATGIYAGDVWHDLAANVFEMEAIVATNFAQNVSSFCDTSQGGGTGTACSRGSKAGVIRGGPMPAVLWEGGSWEVHGVQQDGYGEPMFTQYGKTGLRCARPIE